MTGQMDIAASPTARAGDPAEDQRRDEVLCRLLNTPYRPIDRLRAKALDAEPPRAPAAETSVKA
jgi:hypothetical protein